MFSGAFTALVTPMREGGEVDIEALRALVEWQIARGIDGLVPCGTTGEAATMSEDERFLVVRTVVHQARGRVPVIGGAGANNTRAAIAGARRVQDAGADAQLQVTPYYNKPPQRALLAHFGAIAEACELPMVLYNVPGRTACDMLPATIAELAGLERVAGVKEATGSIQRAQQVIAAVPEGFSVLSGDDFTCAAMTMMGGSGVISVISNVLPAETAALIRAARQGNLAEAQKLHYRMAALMDLLFVEANPVPVKAALSLMGHGQNVTRLPLLPLEGANLEALRGELHRLGVL